MASAYSFGLFVAVALGDIYQEVLKNIFRIRVIYCLSGIRVFSCKYENILQIIRLLYKNVYF